MAAKPTNSSDTVVYSVALVKNPMLYIRLIYPFGNKVIKDIRGSHLKLSTPVKNLPEVPTMMEHVFKTIANKLKVESKFI